MMFSRITEKAGTLTEHGVAFFGGTISISDTVRRRIGDNRMFDAMDDLCSYDGPLYRGEDGKTYAVEFDYSGDVPEPACWWEVRQKEE